MEIAFGQVHITLFNAQNSPSPLVCHGVRPFVCSVYDRRPVETLTGFALDDCYSRGRTALCGEDLNLTQKLSLRKLKV